MYRVRLRVLPILIGGGRANEDADADNEVPGCAVFGGLSGKTDRYVDHKTFGLLFIISFLCFFFFF